MQQTKNISHIIAQKLLGRPLSGQEENDLIKWLEEKDENRKCFEEIKKLKLAEQIISLKKSHYGKEMAFRFQKGLRKTQFTNRYKQLSLWLGSTAAVLLCIVTINLFSTFHSNSSKEASTANLITPGETKATLVLNNGQEINITSENNQSVNHIIDSVNIMMDSEHQKQTAYSKLNIPKGGEFFYQLDDGTKVWLNSESEFRFPEAFTANERIVYLKGEAYFEVVTDKERPFIVSTEQGDIRVYGTSFNLSNYANAPLSAVLVEGSISFRTTKGKEVKIRPDQRLIYYSETDRINIEPADVSTYTAWTNHMFIFKGQTLEDIMTDLARWYNFTPVFTSDELRYIRLSGQLYRYEDIEVLLDSYQQTAGVKFEIRNHNIIITK